jgi:hypothetical protein
MHRVATSATLPLGEGMGVPMWYCGCMAVRTRTTLRYANGTLTSLRLWTRDRSVERGPIGSFEAS